MKKKKPGQKAGPASGEKSLPEGSGLFPLKGYIILNVVFWVYCVIQLVIVSWLFRDIVGLVFFFVVLGVGFTLVSIYDYTYDRIRYKRSRPSGSNNRE